MVAEGDVIDEAPVHVLHHVEGPDGVPDRSDAAHPGQVVGVDALVAVGKGRGAYLEGQSLGVSHLEGRAGSEGEALVDAVAEFAVEVDVDGHCVVFVAADQDGVLTHLEAPAVGCLPVDVEEVGGVEDVVLVEYLLVEPLPQAVVDAVVDVAPNIQIEMVGQELRAHMPVLGLQMEDATRIDIEPVHRAALCQRSSRSENKQEQYKKSFHKYHAYAKL